MAKRKSDIPQVRLSFTISQEDSERLQGIADRLEVSLAWVVRRATTEFLERQGSEPEGALRGVLYSKSTGGGSTQR
ncbi:MAG: CopG family transcriptional regulator [Armatimonadetes bacterium]|nr:CopG family transcriptional regulator [Armatimonadota bacterium]